MWHRVGVRSKCIMGLFDSHSTLRDNNDTALQRDPKMASESLNIMLEKKKATYTSF